MQDENTTNFPPCQGGYLAWERAADLGVRLKELRVALGQSQEEFAELVGVTDQSISDYENGRSQPSRNRLARLARQVGIPVAAFGKGGPRPATLLQRPAAGQTYDVTARSGARASDYATAAVRPLGRRDALEILELKMKLAVKENP